MLYTQEELNEIFIGNKKVFDSAYLFTRLKYGQENANLALYEYLKDGKIGRITRDNGCREKLEKMLYHGEEIEQFLIGYAMSSYIANNMNITMSLDDIYSYAKDMNNPNLKYDRDSIISLVAIAGGWSPYWLVNLIACNEKVKTVLVESLIQERYIDNQKQKLDSSKHHTIVKLTDGKIITVSLNQLNRCFDNMIRDGEKTYFKDDLEISSAKRR